ncbi:phosphotransferase enzyme family protein [Falsibacillus albus]|uniref:Aminoglycoside phosphotransferase domain-containing protein n=1 Tax=Falsibacillus albus TaxID=2478915 RepID=A0A3L7JQI3_9BACI|nr:phosphotransferase [Falsibacillus albus]RLQ93073.1 hypothetical protein D9X91_18745 [Falsibacillus albus]
MKSLYYANIVEEACARFHASFSSYKKLSSGYQNEVFEYEAEGSQFILRFSAPQRRKMEMLESELRFIRFLKENGVGVSVPIRSKDDAFIEKINVDGIDRYASVFQKAPGYPIEVNDPKEWNDVFFEKWGALLGKMHKLSKTYNIEETRQKWRSQQGDILNIGQYLPADLQDKYKNIMAAIQQLPINENLYGLIHNDFHQGNMFVDKGRITLFDFDDCAYNWFANDMAVAFYHAYWQSTSFHPEHTDFKRKFFVSFLKGYERFEKVDIELLNQVPVFLKLREVFLYALFSKHWNCKELQGWQKETMIQLRHSIKNDIPYAGITNFLELR